MTRVALLSHNVVRGDGQGFVNYKLTQRLLEQGVEVHLLADKVDAELVAMGAEWVPVRPRFRRINLVKTWAFRREADRLLRERASMYDVVVGCGAVLSHPHTVNVAHFVHTAWRRSPFHTSRQRSGPYAWYHWLYTALNAVWERRAFGAADTVVAVSSRVEAELRQAGVAPSKTLVIPNGVDPAHFTPDPERRSELPVPDGAPTALFAGDLRSPIKNLDGTLRALVAAPDLHLVVVGAVNGSPYPAQAAALGLGDRVHFLGYRSDLDDVMRSVDFFVLASHSDTFSLVLLEAMATGLPVITARSVGASDLVTPESGIVLERSDDTDALARALSALAASAEKRKEMGSAARAIALNHNWEKMGDRYLELFEEARG